MRAVLALLSLAAALLLPGSAAAQSACQYIVYGTVPNPATGQVGVVLTPGQWNSCFSAKQDALGYVPLNKAGDVMLGKLVLPASSASQAGFNLPQGVAPASPVNGDVWTTSSGVFVRINGVTSQLASSAGSNIFTQPVTINLNAVAVPTADTGIALLTGGVDGQPSRVEVTAAGGSAIFTGRASLGTMASPTTLTNGTLISTFNAHGWDGTSWSNLVAGANRIYAEGTWSNSSHPTELCSSTTPIGSTTIADILCTHNDGGVTIGSLTSHGLGTLNLSGIFVNNNLIVDSSGNITSGTGANITSGGNLTTLGSGTINWAGRSVMQSNSDGNITLLNSTGSSFTSIKLGGTTNLFPEIKRNATAVQFRAADDSGDVPITAAAGTFSGNVSWPGTSGGIPYFNSSTTTASSALLTASALMVGGGAATAPATLASLGTTTTVLHGNASGLPTFGAVNLGTDVTGVLPVGNLAAVNGFVPARLTLQSGVPVMITSQSAKSTIFLDCYMSAQAVLQIPYFNGSQDVLDVAGSCEVSTAMQSSSTGVINNGDVFDVWWVHSGANRICVATNGSGGGWASDTGGSTTARGTGYSQLDRSTRGYVTNKNAITHCYNGATDYGSVSANQATYLGTFASTAAGQTSFTYGASASGGSAGQLYLWNYYNRVSVQTTVTDSGTGYTYTSGTVRQARASAGNQIALVVGVSEDGITASYTQRIDTVAAVNAAAAIGCGFDNTAAFGGPKVLVLDPSTNAFLASAVSTCPWTPGVGIHTLSANEGGDSSNANSFNNTPGVLSALLRM